MRESKRIVIEYITYDHKENMIAKQLVASNSTRGCRDGSAEKGEDVFSDFTLTPVLDGVLNLRVALCNS